ncbi:phosphate acetyltransferase [Micromonospora aurantiaca]|uniref:Phosphate acetyltransferase n=1 Tax=Micromonospora aurantiaca (nom. illeg.) TaxID=47850 RepID=A0A6N3JWW7_9ACTN|nr:MULTISPECIES: phosphate acetyltransferase [Micromonospora]AXH88934.1 phosphate acetyltransferase [Micromonospora aurantiaca]KAB1095917.1 phosphate acetyltransferase [Micromonospora aurantiaca]MDG4754031.1 phosphate acetyltransferase [Micromonospora sp. WMMD718]UFN93710.1 phosphate acetyltransferase [Micromonospora aurantiaca]
MGAVARSVYLTGVGSGGGKSTVALGLAELLSRQVERIGAFRPLVAGDGTDPILALLTERYRMELPVDELYGATYAEASALVADGRREELISRIVTRYREVERRCPAIVVVGSDFAYGDGTGPRELAFNARLATEFGSVVVPVVDGFGQTPDTIAAALRGAYHDLADLGATVIAALANRVPEPMTLPELPVPAYAIPEVPTVSAPTVAEVAAALHGTVLTGDETALDRDVLDYVVGAAHVPTLLDHLTDGALVITPGDRADLLVAAGAAHVAGQVSLAGLVLTLGEQPDPRAMRLVERMNTGLPVLSVPSDSYDTVAASSRIEGRPSTANPRKVEAALGAFERCVDTDDLARRLRVSRSARVTPLMFENDLIDRARARRRRLVLPEGADERILRATEVLLRRGVAEITLLGRPDEIARRTRELGVDLGDAQVVDPVTSPWRDEFAQAYAQLRAHRGVTVELAHDIVAQPNYFGTMMVQTGHADGMVSGATHTTAATIRPAFEIIRTVPGVSVASSVFFMLLADRVLVYGDCAVNPDPDADQLADIAISSADTAARFGIEPRVAMLSYSTGSSGAGADVEKVAAATKLVRERRPDLLVEGPIQYDAAIDPQVAATKLPDSPVAGRATVFIFPDLNTGNNTYKAVQRSAGAVAVGPVMQGLRRPVNDLSRGATVPDIVNTVAITAIQAAAEASE